MTLIHALQVKHYQMKQSIWLGFWKEKNWECLWILFWNLLLQTSIYQNAKYSYVDFSSHTQKRKYVCSLHYNIPNYCRKTRKSIWMGSITSIKIVYIFRSSHYSHETSLWKLSVKCINYWETDKLLWLWSLRTPES